MSDNQPKVNDEGEGNDLSLNTFSQSALYHAIKELLVRKGYLSEAEASNSDEEWTLVQNASWTAYAANVHSVVNAPVPWNLDSMPQWLIDDLEGRDVTAEQEPAPTPDLGLDALLGQKTAAPSTPQTAGTTPVNKPTTSDSGTSFSVNRGGDSSTKLDGGTGTDAGDTADS